MSVELVKNRLPYSHPKFKTINRYIALPNSKVVREALIVNGQCSQMGF